MEPAITPPRRVIAPYVQQEVEVELRPRRFGEALIPQKGYWSFAGIRPSFFKGLVIILEIEVRSFELAEDGGYGALIPRERIPFRTVPLVADNNCAVDPAAQGALVPVPLAELLEGTSERALAYPEDSLMLQGDYFSKMFYAGPIPFEYLIRSFIQQEDALESSKFQ